MANMILRCPFLCQMYKAGCWYLHTAPPMHNKASFIPNVAPAKTTIQTLAAENIAVAAKESSPEPEPPAPVKKAPSDSEYDKDIQ